MNLGRVAGPSSAEPPRAGPDLLDESGRSVRGGWRGTEPFRYVHAPGDSQIESPRSYLYPVRTLSGELLTLCRPRDHVWHEGIAFSLREVNEENFWGGPTFQRGEGYRQLDNNGSMRHLGFDLLDGAARRTGRRRDQESARWPAVRRPRTRGPRIRQVRTPGRVRRTPRLSIVGVDRHTGLANRLRFLSCGGTDPAIRHRSTR